MIKNQCNVDPIAFGERLKTVRSDYALTQRELAGLLGIGRVYCNRMEKGKSLPTLTLVKLLALVLEYREEWLLGELPDEERFSSCILSDMKTQT